MSSTETARYAKSSRGIIVTRPRHPHNGARALGRATGRARPVPWATATADTGIASALTGAPGMTNPIRPACTQLCSPHPHETLGQPSSVRDSGFVLARPCFRAHRSGYVDSTRPAASPGPPLHVLTVSGTCQWRMSWIVLTAYDSARPRWSNMSPRARHPGLYRLTSPESGNGIGSQQVNQ